MTDLVCDFFSAQPASFYSCIAAEGISGIVRYLTNSEDDARQITPDEVRAAHAAGLAVHFFFEMDPTDPTYFTYERGVEDCWNAQERLAWLGAPKGTVVYFAVDAPASVVPPAVLTPYFNGIEATADGELTAGIYGFEDHIEYARANFPNVGKHLFQTYGTVRGPLDGWQHLQRVRCSVTVDDSDMNVEGWRKVMEPIYIGQSAESLVVRVGEVTLGGGIWRWPNGTQRQIPFKTVAYKPGKHVVLQYPPADPDADPTLVLSAEPAVFVIVASDL